MRRAAPAAVVVAAVMYAPIPLTAQTGGGTQALVPVSEMPTSPGGNGAAEAPPAAPPVAPPPAEEPPQLVPAEQVAEVAPPEPPPPPPPLEPVEAVPAQEGVAAQVPEEPVEEPTTPPEPDPNEDEEDPEEFEEEFDDDPPAQDVDDTPAPSSAPVPAAARLPDTGTDVAPVGAIGLLLLTAGLSLRRVRPARR